MSFGWQSALVSALHILGIALSFLAIVERARALRSGDLEAAERADNAWGLSALVVGGTGLARVIWYGKGSAYYLASWAFHAKMGLFGLVLLLELWPMFCLMRFRVERARGLPLSPVPAGALGRISVGQAVVMLGMPVLAAAMARSLPSPF